MLKGTNFDVVAAGSGQLFQCLTLGATAHTTSEGCVYPKNFQKIIEFYNNEKYSQALSLQKKWIRN